MTPTDEGPDTPEGAAGDEVPFGQRFFDRPFVLLALGLLVMLVCFTAWGLWEITSMPTAALP